jgi:hypothetical protein
MVELRKVVATVGGWERKWRKREKNSMRTEVRYTGVLEVIVNANTKF